jgi:hypothetical protein
VGLPSTTTFLSLVWSAYTHRSNLVGDDYQLPTIAPGAFNAMGNIEETAKTGSKTKSDAQITLRLEGYDEFRAIAKNTVYYLESVKRVNKDQEQLRRILQGL